ncbi:hypothetical protein KY290_013998 [Solanum tuberosum]|uniref:PCI domain-containing protein n=1 Tax=Solanum tuberosum TaxID=4113 RepID=A0ABQ7VNE3_SOLTU|nr:hypothetical protein KY284_013401 [Solanum tuberosum]KAH0770017.1 hypothetical protein KY290_013998 [Solanum tuberosum]
MTIVVPTSEEDPSLIVVQFSAQMSWADADQEIDSFLKEWNLGVKDLRGFFLKMSNILKETKGSAKTSFKFLIKYLETFSDEDAFALNEAKEKALHAIIAFVKAPYIFQISNRQILSFPTLCRYLVECFFGCIGYVLLLACNCIGLLHEDCVEKMILLTLVDLGMTETGQIPYSMIKDTLKIDDIEVESWVVKAISVKLLICKIDQMNQPMYRACVWDKSVTIASSKACDLESKSHSS